MPVSTFVALLRGINVGGRNTIPMAELKAVFSALGHEDVVTYLQSGNVVFRCSAGDEDEIAAALEGEVAKAFGVRPTVLLRTPAELRKVAGSNPYLQEEPDLSKLHVVFLSGRPARGAQARLDPERSPPDRFSLEGREIFLHVPNGFGRSKLTIDYFERVLGVKATARNWKTVTKLLALAED